MRYLAHALLTLCSVAVVAGQGAADLQFDVASVRPNVLGPGSPQRVRVDPERVMIQNGTVRTAIQVANPDVIDIEGAPGWVGSGPSGDRFDIDGRTARPSTREEVLAMLRALLRERFKLQTHTEQRSQIVYALSVARSDGRLGAGLRPSAADCATLQERAKVSGASDPCGVIGISSAQGTGRMSGRGLTIDQLAGFLVREVRTPVKNKTGLAGAFDWDLAFTSQNLARPDLDRTRFTTIDPDGPLVFTAVREQLGLQLERQQGNVATLVIDHIERPSEN